MILRFCFIVISLALCLSVPSESARILAVFPTPSISHQVAFRPLTQELAKRGHQVTVLTTDPAFKKGQQPANLTEVDLHDVSYTAWAEHFMKVVNGDSGNSKNIMLTIFKSLNLVFELQLHMKEVQEVLNSKQQFDLILIEACVRQALVFSHVFKAPVIQVSSLGAVPPNYQVLGAPSHPILYPELTRQRLFDLSIVEKIQEIYHDMWIRYLLWSLEDSENKMLKKVFGPNTPSVSQLYENVDMLFLNINPVWDNNRAVPPGVIFMGGIHQKPHKDIPPSDLKTYLDGSKQGVIYMSFGTNVNPSQLPADRIALFNKVFSKLPYDVVWKWDKDSMPGKADNVKIVKWVPQSDLLRHPKVKLFITQAGLQSTDEAISAGMPLIAFPMLGDQWYNAEQYVKHKIGLKLDIAEITGELLEQSIKQVIHDKSYRDNIRALHTAMTDQPQSPLDRAVWWAEYVIRHKGAKHLRSAAANIPWSEYLMLDVVAVLLSAVVGVLAVVYWVVRCLFKQTGKVKKA
uniref:UDP-glucuronosyltransferase n=1 Tax=Plutella xylostella TaxID=51655 RepID=A0A2H4WB75_PLUXY|nr:UDP-glucuronosyltransferase [Plutella xylostella]